MAWLLQPKTVEAFVRGRERRVAMKIVEDCINCTACEPECPNGAITRDEAADIFVVESGRCTECVGAYDSPRCMEVCPVDCIVADVLHDETRKELQAKYARIHGL